MSKLSSFSVFKKAGWQVKFVGGGEEASASNDRIRVDLIETSPFAFFLSLTEVSSGKPLNYSVTNDEAMSDAASVIIRHQPDLDASNFRLLIRDILQAGGSVKADVDGEFVPVTLDDEPQYADAPAAAATDATDAVLLNAVVEGAEKLVPYNYPPVAKRESLLKRLGGTSTSVDKSEFSGSFTIDDDLEGVWYSYLDGPDEIASVALLAETGAAGQAAFRDALAGRLTEKWGTPKSVDGRTEWTVDSKVVVLRIDGPTHVTCLVLNADAYEEFFED